MSEFSQSFFMSDLTLQKLQNQAAIPEKSSSSTPIRILRRSKTDVDEVKDSSSEVIDESPNAKPDVTNPTTKPYQQRSIRERFKNISTQRTVRKVLRRNKSDLVVASAVPKEKKVITPIATVTNKENENYTDFFETFTEEARSQSQKPVPAEPYSIDVSALMNSDFKLNVTESDPISSKPDNVFNISEYFKDNISFGSCNQDLAKVNSNQSKQEESDGQQPETDNEFDKAICEEELNFTLSQKNEEQLPIDQVVLDSSCITFTSDLPNVTLCPSSPTSQKDFLETELQLCKEQVKNILNPDADASFSNNIDLALCNQSFDNTPKPSQFVQVHSNLPTVHDDTPLVLDTTKNLRLISNWGLPETVLQEYKKKGIEEMFKWQSDCLQNTRVLFENANLVYSAPTSSGKTLVSEVLMIKNTLERRKKALFILPFISVVREKTFYLQDLLISSGIRVDGFYGGYQPPGGFEKTDIAICTIEKANSIVNKLLEHNKLSDIGVIVVDEIHLISDPSRGYILELLLAKVLYMCRKFDLKIQIITMSATLPNLELLKNWLTAEFYYTDYRPVELKEMIKIGDSVYDSNMQLIRKVKNAVYDGCSKLPKDPDNIGQLCVETILEGCAVIIFCPSKEWCEKLCLHIAELIYAIGKNKTATSEGIRKQIRLADIEEVKLQLKNCPTGLDSVLAKTISYGCAYHHAGLTTDERDIVESSFKSGILKVIVATSTLSSGVNLPARRVIIRSPLFGGRTMNSLTYRQMIGRAGRKGQDTLGESILVCTEAQAKSGKDLVCAKLQPISSCLDAANNSNLKRAILEIIASGVANTKTDLENFTKCTLLCAEKGCSFKFFADTEKTNPQPLREATHEPDASLDPMAACMEFLTEYEFIRLQLNDETNEMNYVATRLGQACLASSMPPGDGFFLFSELQKSRQCFVLESELHAIYLVTPYSVCSQIQDIDWLAFLDLWEKVPSSMRRVGELVGVRDSFLVRAMRGTAKLDYKVTQVHKRFYIALALQELVNEESICDVAQKYKCNRGLLQSLQQMASTFAGIVTAFCTSLNWHLLAMIVSQFKERLFFGIHRDLIDLMRITSLSSQRARALFKNNVKTLLDLANADLLTIENILHNALSFDTEKKRENENEYDANQRLNLRNFYVTGKQGLTVREAAKILIDEARTFLALEMGIQGVAWGVTKESTQNLTPQVKELSNVVVAESEDIFKTTLSGVSPTVKRLAEPQNKEESPPKIQKLDTKSKVSPARIQKPKNRVEIPAKRKSSPRSANKSIEEIVNSQSQSLLSDTPNNKTKSRMLTQHSRLLRTRLRAERSETKLTKRVKVRKKEISNVQDNPSTTSIELSNHDSNLSIFHHSILMNSSVPPPPVSSDSLETSSAFLSKLNIIDLCKNQLMFDSFFESIEKETVISVALGIAQAVTTQLEQENLIGGNFLKTQRLERPQQPVTELQHDFVIGNSCYIDGIAFYFEANVVYYLNLQVVGSDPNITKSIKMERVKTLFECNDKTWKMYDAKEQLKYLLKILPSGFVDSLSGRVFEDPKVAHWLLNPDAEMSIANMAKQYAPESLPLLDFVGNVKYSSIAMQYKSSVSAKHRASIESCVIFHILAEQLEHLKQIGKGHILKAFTDLEMPIQIMLCKMEMAGVCIDRAQLTTLTHEMSSLMKKVEEKIFQLNGKRFNLSSTAEVAKVLGIHKNIASRSHPSTSKQVLEKIETPMANWIMQYRKLEATLSKTLTPVSRVVSGDRIYGSSFCFTSTGRISMHEPNLQNVAKDFTVELTASESKLISFRSVFRPSKGRCLISVDFCQLELRILTHLSQDSKLMQIMQNTDEDIFRIIAARWNKIPAKDVTEPIRNQTKQICYGIIYGMGMKSLADALKTDEQSAQALTERFHSTYPAIRQYTEKIVKHAREKGYVETMTARRRYLSQIRSENSSDKGQAERQAVNTTIQGSAADIAKYAILRVERNLKKYQRELKINIPSVPASSVDFVLQLHDELIYELPVDKARQVAKILKHSMENCAQLSIPLRVKIKMGPSWGELSEIML